MTVDYVVVGSGLTGAVIARDLVDAGRSVVVLERRLHLGGNVFDRVHASGIRVHAYGPHYFRTNDERLWRFVNRFATFQPYEARVRTLVDGGMEGWPITAATVRRFAGMAWRPEFRGAPANFEEAAQATMPRSVYEKFVRGYTEKQWGVPAVTLSATLARRFEVRMDDDDRLSRHRFQGLPAQGYAGLMQALLRGIHVISNCDYLKVQLDFRGRLGVVFTGSIDEYFGFDLGRLKYRTQRRREEFIPAAGFVQPCAQVNNPDPAAGPHVRTVEWKHLLPQAEAMEIAGSVLTQEIPETAVDPNDYEYPFPNEANTRIYDGYRERARKIPGLLICGRLGEYQYYDMDQAIGRARMLARRLLELELTQAKSL